MKKVKNKKSSNQKNSFYKNVRPKTEAVLTACIAIGLIFFSSYLVHIKSIESLEKEIKIGLKSNVMSAATTIDGDIHAVFDEHTKRDDSLYVAHTEPLEAIRQKSTNIRYLYTNIIIDDKVYFVLNPSPQNDNDGDGFPDLAPALMEEYKDPAPALVKALKEETSTVSDVYQDEWGIFVSAYAPFYNSKGEFVGTLGMDLELNDFFKRLRPIEIAFEKTVIIVFFIGFVIGLLIWYIRRHSQVLLLNKKESQSQMLEATTVLEDTYKENISFLSKIDQFSSQWDKTDKPVSEKFRSWVKHIIQYQQSKITYEKLQPVEFNLLDFIERVKEKMKLKELELEVKNEVKLPLIASGAPLVLYVDAISVLLASLAKITQSNSLKMNLSQKDEGIHDLTLQLELAGNLNEEFDEKFTTELQPIVDPTKAAFNDEEFLLPISIQLLKQYGCTVESFSNTSHSGLTVVLELSKSPEN